MKRTLDDAQIRSPRKAILTYINNQVGAQVAEGSQVAIISDLSHFKVEGEIADTYGDRVAAGGRAIVKIGNEKLEGTVSSVTPLSKNGVISFIVQLNEDNNKRLRSGLKTDVYVMNRQVFNVDLPTLEIRVKYYRLVPIALASSNYAAQHVVEIRKSI